jgi:hypothetical protein
MNIKALAEQAGIVSPDSWKLTVSHMAVSQLDKFAELVAAHEREECAGFAERRDLATENNDAKIGYYHACKTIAAGIRARSKA